jgi:hypothetical protein
LIRVTPASEPAAFDATVRRPGRTYLRSNPNPSRDQFRNANFWKECLRDMRRAYRNICAYSGIWVPTNATVDHYVPKSITPDLAYEWSNFRLALDKVNNYKGDSTEVVDPFTIQDGWFNLDFDSFYVLPSDNLEPHLKRQVQATIGILRLNRDDALVALRFNVVREYALGEVSLSYLQNYYPFIAQELNRQQLTEEIKTRFA